MDATPSTDGNPVSLPSVDGAIKKKYKGAMYILDTNVLIGNTEEIEETIMQAYISVSIPFVVLNEATGLARKQSTALGRRALKVLDLLSRIGDRRVFCRATICGLQIDGKVRDTLEEPFSGRRQERWPEDVKTTDEAIIRAAVNYRGDLAWSCHDGDLSTNRDVVIVSDDVSLGVMATAYRVPVFKWKQFVATVR
jgi:predicted ribonuclease YlaK